MKRGFEPFRLPQVTLESGRDFFQSITLQPGTIIEEVEVVPNGTAKPRPSSATGKPSRIRVGGDIEAPHLITKVQPVDRKSTRLNSSHTVISYAVFCLKKKNNIQPP